VGLWDIEEIDAAELRRFGALWYEYFLYVDQEAMQSIIDAKRRKGIGRSFRGGRFCFMRSIVPWKTPKGSMSGR
jgi:hypothetical protein